jgi:hypothetical protein
VVNKKITRNQRLDNPVNDDKIWAVSRKFSLRLFLWPNLSHVMSTYTRKGKQTHCPSGLKRWLKDFTKKSPQDVILGSSVSEGKPGITIEYLRLKLITRKTTKRVVARGEGKKLRRRNFGRTRSEKIGSKLKQFRLGGNDLRLLDTIGGGDDIDLRNLKERGKRFGKRLIGYLNTRGKESLEAGRDSLSEARAEVTEEIRVIADIWRAEISKRGLVKGSKRAGRRTLKRGIRDVKRMLRSRKGRRRMISGVLPRTVSPNHPLSKKIRPAFEIKWIKSVLGIPLAGTTLVGAMMAPLSVLGKTNSEPIEIHRQVIEDKNQGQEGEFNGELTVSDQEEALVTKPAVGWPLPVIKITQGFNLAHPGLDLKAEIGDPVWAIESGKIAETNHWKWGYGNHVVIDHGSGRKTLYAHLSEIDVEVGDEVKTGRVIGKIGISGWSSGSHLHLEVIENGIRINPRRVLGI